MNDNDLADQETTVNEGEVHSSFLAMDGIANHRKADAQTNNQMVSWVAPEFDQTPKTLLWFGGLILGVLAASAVIYLFTRDWMSPIFIVGLAGITWYYAHRKPEDRNFTLDNEGLDMGKNFYPLSNFKSFAVDTTSGAVPSVVLYPLKRFMPPLTLTSPADKLQDILKILSVALPVEAHNPTRFDLMMSKIKF